MLVAIQSKEEKRRSSPSDHKHERVPLCKLPKAISRTSLNRDDNADNISHLTLSQRSSCSQSSSDTTSQGTRSSQGDASTQCSEETEDPFLPPFDPAPYYPEGFTEEDEERLHSSVEELKESKALQSFLCDSLHIHPNELPQTLESILKSAIYTVSGETLLSSYRPIKYIPTNSRVIKRDKSENETSESSNTTLTSGRYISEEDYLPMTGLQTPEIKEENTMAETIKPNTKLKHVQELGALLQTAINDSDIQRAQELAKTLALEPVTVSVDVNLKPNTPDDKNKEFR